jgi:hypothetical protein
MNANKTVSAAVIGMMLMSLLVSGVATAVVTPISPNNAMNLDIAWTNLNDVYVGQQNVSFDIGMEDHWETGQGDSFLWFCNMTASTTLHDENGNSVTNPVTWDDPSAIENVLIIEAGGSEDFDNFQFDVLGNAIPGEYNITFTLSGLNETFQSFTYTCYIHFYVLARATVNDIGPLTPGDRNRNVWVDVDVHAWMEDMTLTVTRPDLDFSWFGSVSATASAFYDGPIAGGDHDFPFTISVAADKDAGTYDGSYVITYTNNQDIVCTETGDIDFVVGHLAMLSAASATTTLQQGTNRVNITFTFTNTGTVNLFQIKLLVDPLSSDFTFMPADHWEGDDTVSYSWLELGDIAVGDDITRSMVIGFDSYMPEGRHKLMFSFNGFYYDPNALTYQQVNMHWTSIPAYPEVHMGMSTLSLTPESSTVDGPFLMLNVLDQKIDVSVTSTVTLSKEGKLVDNTLSVEVQNYGYIDYSNVVLQIETNSANSPFLNVISPGAGFSEEAKLTGMLNGGSTENVGLKVTLKDDAQMGVFMVAVRVRGINTDMGELVNDTVEARITIRGVGPKLQITTVSPKIVGVGSTFTLTLTIENKGDDTARNVLLWSVSSQTSGNAIIVIGDANTEVNGELTPPVATASPIILPDIAPGANVTVSLPMKTSADIESGHVFEVTIGISYVDSMGYGPSSEETYHRVAVKTSGWGGSVISWFYIFLVVLTIVVMICLAVIVFIWAKKNRVKKGAPQIVASEPPPPPPQ